MAFGPHGPRAPTSAPGDGLKIFLGTVGCIGAAGVLYFVLQHFGKSLSLFYKKKRHFGLLIQNFFFVVAAPPPKTLTKEWQEASNERAKEMKLNPISGTQFTSLHNIHLV